MTSGRSPAAAGRDRDGLFVLTSVVGLGVVAVLLAGAGPQRPRAADVRTIAAITHASGGVLRRPTGTLAWDTTSTGEALAPLDALYVPTGGAASLTFADGASVDLDERSLLIVEPAADERVVTPAVRLVRGSLEAGSGGAPATVRSPSGHAVLEPGARARFEAAPSGSAWVAPRKGAVRVDGARVEAPSYPVSLREPGARLYLASFPGEVTLRWEGDGAAVQLARDPSFSEPVALAAAPSTGEARAPIAEPGVYHWRLVAADGTPRSETRRLHVLAERAPELWAPVPGELVRASTDAEVRFWWTEVEGASRYQLEIGADPDFTRVIATRDVEGSSAWLALDAPEGTYHWRVRALDDARPSAPFSAPASFRLIRAAVPGAPELLDPTLEVGDAPP